METVGNFCVSPEKLQKRKGRKSRKSSKRFFSSPKFFQTRSLVRVMLKEKGKWEPVEKDCETDHIFSDV